MKRLGWAFLLFWLVWGLLWVALSRWHVQSHSPTLWYADPSMTLLVPVRASAAVGEGQTPTAQAAAIASLLRHSVPAGLVSPVSGLEAVQEVSVSEGNARLSLVLRPGLGSTAENLAVGALVRSLDSLFPTVSGWQVELRQPGGQVMESAHLDLSQPLRPVDFENRLDGAGQGLMARLWLRVPGTIFLVPCVTPLVGRTGMPGWDALAMLTRVREWAPGRVAAPWPNGMTLDWVSMEAGVVTLRVATDARVSRDLQMSALVAVVNTLLGIPGIDAVNFRPAPGVADLPLPVGWQLPVRRDPGQPEGYIWPVGVQT